jgi:hypothetical protein
VNPILIYLVVLLIAGFTIIMDLMFYNKQKKGLSRLTGVAFAMVTAGIFLGRQAWIGYSLLGIGMILAIADIFQKAKNWASYR